MDVSSGGHGEPFEEINIVCRAARQSGDNAPATVASRCGQKGMAASLSYHDNDYCWAMKGKILYTSKHNGKVKKMQKNKNKPVAQAGDKYDRLSKKQRSLLMSKVRGTDTGPEIMLRKELFSKGFRYRKNVAGLPGKPDIVLPKYRAVIFIHGCFWHQHPGCKESARPKSRQDYWEAKLNRNVERDALNVEKLKNSGWRVYIVWECELRPQCRRQTMNDLIDALLSLKTNPGEC